MLEEIKTRYQIPKRRLFMVRLMAGLVVALLGAAPVWAGELDGDFVGVPGMAPKVQEKAIAAPLSSLAQQMDAKAALAKSSELDEESPAQAYRRGGWGGGGWGRGGGGWGRGWGRGWGGWGRGWGGGWGRGWYGYRGWGWGR